MVVVCGFVGVVYERSFIFFFLLKHALLLICYCCILFIIVVYVITLSTANEICMLYK